MVAVFSTQTWASLTSPGTDTSHLGTLPLMWAEEKESEEEVEEEEEEKGRPCTGTPVHGSSWWFVVGSQSFRFLSQSHNE